MNRDELIAHMTTDHDGISVNIMETMTHDELIAEHEAEHEFLATLTRVRHTH